MDRRTLMLQELQMLTGVITDDYDYLLALLIKPEKQIKDDTSDFQYTRVEEVGTDVSLDDWFSQFNEEV